MNGLSLSVGAVYMIIYYLLFKKLKPKQVEVLTVDNYKEYFSQQNRLNKYLLILGVAYIPVVLLLNHFFGLSYFKIFIGSVATGILLYSGEKLRSLIKKK